jgi:hypothetical protein
MLQKHECLNGSPYFVQANVTNPLSNVIGTIPHRLQLAGGWIDQPFVSRHNPEPPGSMVVVQIEPTFCPMERSGIATGTRATAARLWNGSLPNRPLPELVRELYAVENKNKKDPSGSQDMTGIIYPGINRLDYDYNVEGGVFAAHIESLNDSRVARWLEGVLHLLPVQPRPPGYSPLGEKNLAPEWIARLSQSGKDCFDSIRRMDVEGLGASFNLTMNCWEKLLPQTVRHPLIQLDLKRLLNAYQSAYPGAMYSGCGGGYLMVVSEKPIPSSLRIQVRLART